MDYHSLGRFLEHPIIEAASAGGKVLSTRNAVTNQVEAFLTVVEFLLVAHSDLLRVAVAVISRAEGDVTQVDDGRE